MNWSRCGIRLSATGLVLAAAATLASSAQADPITISGTFIATSAACGTGTVVCSGVGTSQVSWGTPVAPTVRQSSLRFTPSTTLDASGIMPGDVITLGTLRFVNGTAELGTWINSATLEIDTGVFADPLRFVINTVNTLCVGDEHPDVCADYIHFRDSDVFGSFRVREGFHGTVEVKGLVGSLSLYGFGQVVGFGAADPMTMTEEELGPSFDPSVLPPDLQAAFLDPSVYHPTANPAPVPEPTTLLPLIGLGLAAARRRRVGSRGDRVAGERRLT